LHLSAAFLAGVRKFEILENGGEGEGKVRNKDGRQYVDYQL
jgi:hypothetical protein